MWGFLFLGLGTFIGSFFNKVYLDKFPDLNKNDKILIVAPHIDDEVIGSGGLIQRTLSVGAKVKVVYMTNGDNTLASVVAEEKNLRLSGGDFVALGEERMKEGKKATAILGLKENDLYFLGYPDRGLSQLFSNYYGSDKKYPARGTKFTYNPYSGTYREGQDYNGENLFTDLSAVINGFEPNILIIPHFADIHPDHKATYRFIDKYLTENNIRNKSVWMYLVHYKNYPADRFITLNKFLYPPQRLFSKGGWFSFDLDSDEVTVKLKAVDENKSQLLKVPALDLRRFVKRNEIFEIHEL
jgi:LmbE family N-acetylglucosaminyl deacetylase